MFQSHSSQATSTCTESARSSNMSSANVNNTTAQSTVGHYPDILTTILEAKGDHPLSPPESAPYLGDTPDSTRTKPQWNGDPMDWESWPTGRPGPFVSESKMQEVMNLSQYNNRRRGEQSRARGHVLHIAEFLRLVRASSIFITIQLNNNLFKNICWTRHGTGAGYSVGSEH